MNGDLPAFHRAYAWYRCFRHWASLRFHDTCGIHGPSSLQKLARGVYGELHRTKTTGPDKQISVLPVFVSYEAYLQEEWLQVGLDLWMETFNYPRDYLLCLPLPDFSGPCGRRAKYTDAQSFSKALMASLKAPDGSPLLEQEAIHFWTEHSDRAGVDSWLSAIGSPGT